MPKRRRRIVYWRRLVAQQAASTLSATAFCREEQISLNQFYRWRRRFRREQAEQEFTTGFVELTPCSTDANTSDDQKDIRTRQSESGVRLRCGDNLWIEVERGFDPFTLRAVIETLCAGGAKPCSP